MFQEFAPLLKLAVASLRHGIAGGVMPDGVVPFDDHIAGHGVAIAA